MSECEREKCGMMMTLETEIRDEKCHAARLCNTNHKEPGLEMNPGLRAERLVTIARVMKWSL